MFYNTAQCHIAGDKEAGMDKKERDVAQFESILVTTLRRKLFKAANVGIDNRPYLMELHGDRNCQVVHRRHTRTSILSPFVSAKG